MFRPKIADLFGVQLVEGIVVYHVDPKKLGFAAGFRDRDIIQRLNSSAIAGPAEFWPAFQKVGADNSVKVDALAGTQAAIQAELEVPRPLPAVAALPAHYGLQTSPEPGLVVLEASPAGSSGLCPGDLILQVEELPTPDFDALDDAVRALVAGDRLALLQQQGGLKLRVLRASAASKLARQGKPATAAAAAPQTVVLSFGKHADPLRILKSCASDFRRPIVKTVQRSANDQPQRQQQPASSVSAKDSRRKSISAASASADHDSGESMASRLLGRLGIRKRTSEADPPSTPASAPAAAESKPHPSQAPQPQPQAQNHATPAGASPSAGGSRVIGWGSRWRSEEPGPAPPQGPGSSSSSSGGGGLSVSPPSAAGSSSSAVLASPSASAASKLPPPRTRRSSATPPSPSPSAASTPSLPDKNKATAAASDADIPEWQREIQRRRQNLRNAGGGAAAGGNRYVPAWKRRMLEQQRQQQNSHPPPSPKLPSKQSSGGRPSPALPSKSPSHAQQPPTSWSLLPRRGPKGDTLPASQPEPVSPAPHSQGRTASLSIFRSPLARGDSQQSQPSSSNQVSPAPQQASQAGGFSWTRMPSLCVSQPRVFALCSQAGRGRVRKTYTIFREGELWNQQSGGWMRKKKWVSYWCVVRTGLRGWTELFWYADQETARKHAAAEAPEGPPTGLSLAERDALVLGHIPLDNACVRALKHSSGCPASALTPASQLLVKASKEDTAGGGTSGSGGGSGSGSHANPGGGDGGGGDDFPAVTYPLQITATDVLGRTQKLTLECVSAEQRFQWLECFADHGAQVDCILREGWLLKQRRNAVLGSSNGPAAASDPSNWKKRYVVLHADRLAYYHKQSDEKPSSEIHFSELSGFSVFTNTAATLRGAKRAGGGCGGGESSPVNAQQPEEPRRFILQLTDVSTSDRPASVPESMGSAEAGGAMSAAAAAASASTSGGSPLAVAPSCVTFSVAPIKLDSSAAGATEAELHALFRQDFDDWAADIHSLLLDFQRAEYPQALREAPVWICEDPQSSGGSGGGGGAVAGGGAGGGSAAGGGGGSGGLRGKVWTKAYMALFPSSAQPGGGSGGGGASAGSGRPRASRELRLFQTKGDKKEIATFLLQERDQFQVAAWADCPAFLIAESGDEGARAQLLCCRSWGSLEEWLRLLAASVPAVSPPVVPKSVVEGYLWVTRRSQAPQKRTGLGLGGHKAASGAAALEWRKRYVVLAAGVLQWYRTKADAQRDREPEGKETITGDSLLLALPPNPDVLASPKAVPNALPAEDPLLALGWAELNSVAAPPLPKKKRGSMDGDEQAPAPRLAVGGAGAVGESSIRPFRHTFLLARNADEATVVTKFSSFSGRELQRWVAAITNLASKQEPRRMEPAADHEGYVLVGNAQLRAARRKDHRAEAVSAGGGDEDLASPPPAASAAPQLSVSTGGGGLVGSPQLFQPGAGEWSKRYLVLRPTGFRVYSGKLPEDCREIPLLKGACVLSGAGLPRNELLVVCSEDEHADELLLRLRSADEAQEWKAKIESAVSLLGEKKMFEDSIREGYLWRAIWKPAQASKMTSFLGGGRGNTREDRPASWEPAVVSWSKKYAVLRNSEDAAGGGSPRLLWFDRKNDGEPSGSVRLDQYPVVHLLASARELQGWGVPPGGLVIPAASPGAQPHNVDALLRLCETGGEGIVHPLYLAAASRAALQTWFGALQFVAGKHNRRLFEEAACEGYLRWDRHRHGRYFVLQPDALQMYRKPGDRKPAQTWALTHGTEIVPTPADAVADGSELGFTLVFKAPPASKTASAAQQAPRAARRASSAAEDEADDTFEELVQPAAASAATPLPQPSASPASVFGFGGAKARRNSLSPSSSSAGSAAAAVRAPPNNSGGESGEFDDFSAAVGRQRSATTFAPLSTPGAAAPRTPQAAPVAAASAQVVAYAQQAGNDSNVCRLQALTPAAYVHWLRHLEDVVQQLREAQELREIQERQLRQQMQEEAGADPWSQTGLEYDQEELERARNLYDHTFLDMIENPRCLQRYRRFAASQFVEENILFYLAVADYKRGAQQPGWLQSEAALEEALTIFSTFIRVDSEYEVNISSEMRGHITELFEGSTAPRLDGCEFDAARAEVVRLIETNCFPRFKSSPSFYDFVVVSLRQNAPLPAGLGGPGLMA